VPRAYDVKTVALALDVPSKWLDNLLSHHSLPGITRSRQGVGRVIVDEGVLAIELVRLLTEFGVGVARAVAITREVMSSREHGELRYEEESGIVVDFPTAVIQRRLRERMVDAIDAVARAPRGRPPRNS
jgi:hypothetical protein